MIKNYKVIFDAGKINGRYKSMLQTGLENVSRAITDEARIIAPVKTGKLQDSIEYEMGEENLSSRIGSPLPYARHQEFGTRYHGPQAFLRPALDKILAIIDSFYRK